MRNSFKTLLQKTLFLWLGLLCFSAAATNNVIGDAVGNFSFGGHCYPSLKQAAEAFVRSFPISSATSTGFASITLEEGDLTLVGYGLEFETYDNILRTNKWQRVFFNECVPEGGEFDYTLAAAFFAFSFSFVLGCFFISRGLGLVLSGIKRF